MYVYIHYSSTINTSVSLSVHLPVHLCLSVCLSVYPIILGCNINQKMYYEEIVLHIMFWPFGASSLIISILITYLCLHLSVHLSTCLSISYNSIHTVLTSGIKGIHAPTSMTVI